MKKFFAAVCCVLLVGGSVVAQEVVTPVAETPVVDAAVTTETAAPAVVQEAAPAVVQEAAPAGSIMEGVVMDQAVPMPAQPMMVQSSGCCGGGVVAPYSAPMMNSVVGTPAPMMNSVVGGCSSCGTAVAAAPVVDGCSTCGTTTRRYVVRSTVSGFRSRVGNIGSRRNACCN